MMTGTGELCILRNCKSWYSKEIALSIPIFQGLTKKLSCRNKLRPSAKQELCTQQKKIMVGGGFIVLLLLALLWVCCSSLQVGINIDPSNAFGNASPKDVGTVNASWVRVEYHDLSTDASHPDPVALETYGGIVHSFNAANIKVMLIVDYASMVGKPSGTAPAQAWDAYIANYVQRVAAVAKAICVYSNHLYLEVWNEEDLSPQPGYDVYVPSQAYGKLLGQSYTAIKGAAPCKTTVVMGGLASGVPTYIDEVLHYGGKYDAVGLHPYGRRPTPTWPSPTWGFGVVTDLIQQYYEHASAPIYVTEVGTNLLNVQSEFPLRTFNAIQSVNGPAVCPVVIWFCWSDGMVTPFGLVDSKGKPKQSYWSFASFGG